MTIDNRPLDRWAKNRLAGFVVIEMMVVLSVIAVLWAIAISGIREHGGGLRTREIYDILGAEFSAKRSFYLVMNQPVFAMWRLLRRG